MAETVILPETTLSGFVQDNTGLYGVTYEPSLFVLTPGEEYRVVWDNEEYTVTAMYEENLGLVYAGNGEDVGATGNGEPFALLYSPVYEDFPDNSSIYAIRDYDKPHTIAIYQGATDTPAAPTGVDIVLKDRSGNPVQYPGVNTIKVNTTDGGTQNFGAYDPETLTPDKLAEGVTVGNVVGTMTTPLIVENVIIEPDFSGGDFTANAPDGVAIRSAIIQKPDALTPENIAEGVDIAGIIGTLAAGGNMKLSTGKVTGAGVAETIAHGLGVVPDIVGIYTTTTPGSVPSTTALMGVGLSTAMRNALTAVSDNNIARSIPGLFYGIHFASGNKNVGGTFSYTIDSQTTQSINSANAESFKFGTASMGLYSGAPYFWFAIGGLT